MTAVQSRAELTYYIVEGVLVGSAGGKRIHMTAVSGGGGGSTKVRPAVTMNNPYMTGFKTVKHPHRHGGPLPVGKYQITTPANHPQLGLSAQLKLVTGSASGRSGFFIHGRGPHGSDGCIVPLSSVDFKALMEALTTAGGGTLHVLEAVGDTRMA